MVKFVSFSFLKENTDVLWEAFKKTDINCFVRMDCYIARPFKSSCKIILYFIRFLQDLLRVLLEITVGNRLEIFFCLLFIYRILSLQESGELDKLKRKWFEPKSTCPGSDSSKGSSITGIIICHSKSTCTPLTLHRFTPPPPKKKKYPLILHLLEGNFWGVNQKISPITPPKLTSFYPPPPPPPQKSTP